MNSSCVSCLKSLVVSLHFLCWLCGAFVVAFGEFQMMHSRFDSLVTTFWPIYPANTLVVTGTIVTCVCYLGVLGGMRENRCMLITFYILLFILMLVELAMACAFFVYSREIDTHFEKDLTHSLEIYIQSSSEGNKTIKEDFDAVQYLFACNSFKMLLEAEVCQLASVNININFYPPQFKCCGVHGPEDWKGNSPLSCCTKDPCNIADQPNWQEGCLVKLRNWFVSNYLSTASGVVTMFMIQFVCLSVTIPLFCHFHRRGLGYK